MSKDRITERVDSMADSFEGKKESPIPDGNYLDLKSDLKKLDEQMKEMKEALEKELSIAAMNGMTPETGDRIVELQRQIEQSKDLSEQHLKEIAAIENQIKEQTAAKFKEAGEKISGTLNKVKDSLVDKIVSSVAATKAMGSKVQQANRDMMERGSINRDTFNTVISEDIHQVGRNWMSFNYEKDRVISSSLDKVADSLEKLFERGANIKEAFKDIGRAITGKERQNDKGVLTPKQQGLIGKIRGMSSEIQGEMQELEQNFERSRSVSIANIKGAMEYRDESKQEMKESSGLQKRFEAAKEASIASKSDAQSRGKVIEEKDKEL
jgi:hypothetical protein